MPNITYFVCRLNNLCDVVVVIANFRLPGSLQALHGADRLIQISFNNRQLPRHFCRVDVQELQFLRRLRQYGSRRDCQVGDQGFYLVVALLLRER